MHVRRKLLFGERIDPKWLAPVAPIMAGAGLGVNEALDGGSGARPVQGATREALHYTMDEPLTLQEALASKGLTLRVAGFGVEEPLPPNQIRRGERLLQRLGFATHDIGISEFQIAVGVQVTGTITDETLKKLASTSERVRAHKPPYLTRGTKSERVKRLQQRLKRLGDFEGVPNGIYGESTVAAVLSFRARHHIGESGSWTKGAQRRLMKELGNIAHDPYRTRGKPSEKGRDLDRKALREARTRGIGPDSHWKVIAHLQDELKLAGYDPNREAPRERGVWDDHTQAMADQFRERAGLPVTPRFNARAWQKLAKSSIETRGRFSPKLDVDERSSAVLHFERDLKKAGGNINPDRLYTERTERVKDNVVARAGLHGTDGAGKRVHKAVHRAISAVQKKTVRGCARLLLDSPNVLFWQDLSTGPDDRLLRQIARTGRSFVPATGGTVTPNLRMMQALVEMSEHGTIQINALTGGFHSTGSNHYSGTAVDLSIQVGDVGEMVRIANKHGGFRNSESDHIHLDF